MATGLVTLLMVASVAANELIIRSIRSVRGVESSNRAYFAAEAGIEDGLYELSPHLPGYQTPSINTGNARNDQFEEAAGRLVNRWDIESRSGQADWQGKMLKGQKLILSFYSDNSTAAAVVTNAINAATIADSDIVNLAPGNFSIKFSIPDKGVTDISDVMNNSFNLLIDNDQDGKINEDAPSQPLPGMPPSPLCPDGSKNPNPEDNDCDGKVDEDSDMDPVILWKLTDNNGRSLIPLKGCLRDSGAPPGVAPGYLKSETCEKDFKWVGAGSSDNWSETLNEVTWGLNEKGDFQTIGGFILDSKDAVKYPNDRMQMELLIVAPMEFVNPNTNPLKKVAIPYIQYEVKSDSPDIPYPYFTIKSDGYHGTYKQSITTTVTPKTSVPLFDFTIIQQQ